MPACTISVKGKASIPRTAERAIVDVKVQVQGDSPKVSATAISTSNELQRLFRAAAQSDGTQAQQATAAIAQWTMTSMTTTSWYEYDREGRRSLFAEGSRSAEDKPRTGNTYRARLDFQLRVRNFELLGEMAAKLGSMEHVKIELVRWALTSGAIEVHKSELRKMATTDALRRARDYAEAMGLNIVRPLELKEEEVHIGGRYGGAVTGALFGSTGQTTQHQEVEHVVFRPEEIEMSTNVFCVFLGGNEEDFK